MAARLLVDRPDIGNARMPITTRAIVSSAAHACASGLWNPDTRQCTTADQVQWVQSRSLPGANTARRNAAISPGMIQTDLNIMKKFRVKEPISFELRAEIFGVINHQDFNYAPNGFTKLGARVEQSAGAFLPWRTQQDSFSSVDRPSPHCAKSGLERNSPSNPDSTVFVCTSQERAAWEGAIF